MLVLLAVLVASLEGTYDVVGNHLGPTGKPYVGTAEIAIHGEIYHMNWDMTSDGKQYTDIGSGLKVGDQLNFVFKSLPTQEEQYEGLQIYKIKENVLEGPYILFEGRYVGHEKLKKRQ